MNNSAKHPLISVSDHLGDLEIIFNTLSGDCKAILERIEETPEQLDYRAYVRSLFALIESMLYSQKQLARHVDSALKAASPYFAEHLGLNPLELLATEEKGVQVTEKGEVKETVAFMKFKQNFKFSFIAMAKCCGSDFKPEYTSTGWSSLVTALEVRDRLMHPKKVEDLEVTPVEFKIAQRASSWFNLVFHIALQSQQESFFNLLGTFAKEDSLIIKAKDIRKTIPGLLKKLEELESKNS
jgi:hypothetical protein